MTENDECEGKSCITDEQTTKMLNAMMDSEHFKLVIRPNVLTIDEFITYAKHLENRLKGLKEKTKEIWGFQW